MKQLNRTKVTVRIRKAVFRDEWYLCIESYPVFVPGKSKPQRIVEALNRTVTSIVWDKKRIARTTETSKTFKPKRDENGIIMCKTEKDQQACLYADGVRKLRQREYDNADLYSDTETAQAEQKEKLQQNFIEYFDNVAQKRHARSSESICINWKRTNEFLKQFAGNTLLFSQIDNRLAEEFKRFLLSAPCGGNRNGIISHNTAATYFSIFKAALKQTFVDGYLTIDLSAKIKGIQEQESRREYLTVEELNTLAATPCERDVLKRSALFSALTGLRHCDIQKLQWKEISMDGNQARLHFTQQKTKGVEYMPIFEQALQLCGERHEPEQLVFEDLPDPAWISKPLSLGDIRKEQLQNRAKEQEEILNIALSYTQKTFAPYVSNEQVELLCNNLKIYADKLSLETLHPVKTGKDLSTIDIFHFGWNVWNHFKISKQIDIAHFLKKVFPDILIDVEVETIKRHLKDDELKGIIKIKEKL